LGGGGILDFDRAFSDADKHCENSVLLCVDGMLRLLLQEKLAARDGMEAAGYPPAIARTHSFGAAGLVWWR
jgi:hypothetical protein